MGKGLVQGLVPGSATRAEKLPDPHHGTNSSVGASWTKCMILDRCNTNQPSAFRPAQFGTTAATSSEASTDEDEDSEDSWGGSSRDVISQAPEQALVGGCCAAQCL